MNPYCIEILVLVTACLEIVRPSPDDGGHGGPDFLAVPGHLVDFRGTDLVAIPIAAIARLVHEEMADDRSLIDVLLQIEIPVTVDPRLPDRHVEAVGISDVGLFTREVDQEPSITAPSPLQIGDQGVGVAGENGAVEIPGQRLRRLLSRAERN